MNAHIGNIIKNLLFEKRISVRWLAKEIGVTPNGVYAMLKRKYIHPEWVAKISRSLNYDLFQHVYHPPEDLKQDENAALQQELDALRKENAHLKEFIELLKEKKK